MRTLFLVLILTGTSFGQDAKLLNLAAALKNTVSDIQATVNDHEERLLKLEGKKVAAAVAIDYKSWISANYSRPKGSLRAYNNSFKNGMMANESIHLVWQHLKSDHGFQNINHLEQWEALALHDAAHGNKIKPVKVASAKLATVTARSYNNCANGQCARPSFFTRRKIRKSNKR